MRPIPFRPMAVIAASALSLGLLAACGDGDSGTAPADSTGAGGTPVTVRLTNWKVEPSASEVPAGKVTFTALHPSDDGGGHGHGAMEAGATHQLVVAPLDEGARAGESRFTNPVVNLSDIKVGQSKTATVDLAPGKYELNCLVVEKVNGTNVNHYTEGMYALLTVK